MVTRLKITSPDALAMRVGLQLDGTDPRAELRFAGSDDPSFLDPDALRALYRLADASARKLPPEATSSDRLVATVSALADGLDLWSKNGQLPVLPAEPEPVSQGLATTCRKSFFFASSRC